MASTHASLGNGQSDETVSTDTSNDDRSEFNGYSGIGNASNSSSVAVVRRNVRTALAHGASIVSRTGQSVSVANIGSVNFQGSTDILLGNKAEYIGPVTIQQVVHGADEVSQVDRSLQGIVRRRGRLEFGDTSVGGVERRTGLVLNKKWSGNDTGDIAATTGSSLLLKHLLGRQPRILTWIPILLLNFMLFMSVTINKCVLWYFHDPVPSSQGTAVNIKSYNQSLKVPVGNQEPALNLSRSVVISRSMWFAHPPKEVTPLNHPVEYVIISHTATEQRTNQAECSLQVRLVQKFHVMSRNWSDVGYNFLVGGDGNAYEGRGWEYVGAHAKGYNVVSIGISFIGTFSDVLPPPAQIRACKMLIKEGVRLGKVSPDYKLIGHRQVSPTESPGEKLYEELQRWEHWSPEV